MEWQQSLLGRAAPSGPQSRFCGAWSRAGLDGAYRAIMACGIICNTSDRRDIAEARTIGQHSMHDDGSDEDQGRVTMPLAAAA